MRESKRADAPVQYNARTSFNVYAPFALVLIGLFTQSAIGQESSSAPIRVTVREVLVPVIVTDKKGHHVTGLNESDFRISEDGVPQEISAFSTDTAASAARLLAAADAASNPAAPAPSPAGNGGAPLGHTFVICIDTLHTAMSDSSRIREALMQVFSREKPAGAQYVVVGIGRRLQVLRTATSDPAAVLAALRNPSFQPALGGGDAAAFASELNDLKNEMFDFCRRCGACASRSNVHSCDAEIQALKNSLDAEAERQAAYDRQMLAELKSVVEEIAKLPTGRTLIFISDGFSLQPAREFYSVAGSFLPYEPRFHATGAIDLQPEMKAVVSSAVERNVRVYSFNSLGVQQTAFAATGSMDASAPSDRSPQSVISHNVSSSSRGGTLFSDMDHAASSVAFENTTAMEQLARATGGVYFHDNNDMAKQFRSAIGDGRDYYLIAYTPKNPGQGSVFHTITVEVANRKLQVRAKSGYWTAEPDK